MQLTEKQREVLLADGHVLVTGGPGSGKTTVSILKAARLANELPQSSQKVLFLSFARATVSRVVEAIEYEQAIPLAQKRRIEVSTYHSFFWRILRTHGYLIGLPRRLSILAPHGEAVALSNIRSRFPSKNLTQDQKLARTSAEDSERSRLAEVDGSVCFQVFALKAGELVRGSARVRRLVATMYPVIVLDEFQDTNEAQWRIVQALGDACRLIAMADPEQRIYDWIGADPARLDHFREAFKPTVIDLSTDNHRSPGTEIAAFGDDLLTGRFREGGYAGIVVDVFYPRTAQAMTKLLTTTYSARKRLIGQGIEDWSIAILVPTKKMTRLVSDALREPPAGMAAVPHLAVVEMEGAILASEVVAMLLQPADNGEHLEDLFELLRKYFQGKGGERPTKESLTEASNVQKAREELVALHKAGKSPRKNSILARLLAVYERTCSLTRSGDPDEDWRSLCLVLKEGECKRLKEIAEAVRNIRMLQRGQHLRRELAQDWRTNGAYSNALAITRRAFMRDQLSANPKPETGVVVMNMHKAKGKQFDEVIVFEGWPAVRHGRILSNPNRIVRSNFKTAIDDQTRQNLRVSVTRAKSRTTILTPKSDPCILLISREA